MSYRISRDLNNNQFSQVIVKGNAQVYPAYMSGDVNLTTSYQDILSYGSLPPCYNALVIANVYEDLSAVTAISTGSVYSLYDLYVGSLYGEEQVGCQVPILAAAIVGQNAGMRTFVWNTSWSSESTVKVQAKLAGAGSVTGNWTVKRGPGALVYTSRMIIQTLEK